MMSAIVEAAKDHVSIISLQEPWYDAISNLYCSTYFRIFSQSQFPKYLIHVNNSFGYLTKLSQCINDDTISISIRCCQKDLFTVSSYSLGKPLEFASCFPKISVRPNTLLFRDLNAHHES